ncbi:MAG TPA: CBS domain-containing protein [Rhodocyclaceae bacterium]|nr:CBS domain-containing protein [Rhodocyclaceae bacterium]
MTTRKISAVIDGRPTLIAEADISVREAAHRMVAAHVGSIMIVDDGLLVGIFTERDVLTRVLACDLDPAATRVGDVMTPEPQTVTADRPLGHALHLMHDGGFRHMPVVRDGRPVGMISVRDALGGEMLEFEHELEQRDQITEVL